ncbi:MAG: CBS domain-containing protein [Candidatus Heimdallarchaeota archaeon]|nr:CBS domain-containing protein [Candidatus Heimdallarchaeota archaeon]
MNTTKIKDLMTKGIISINSDDNAITASEVMIHNNIGSVLVFDGSNPIGIITERDIVKKVITDCKDLCETRAADLATCDLITLGPNDAVKQALITMYKNKIKRIPIQDPETNELIGIITTYDIIAAFNSLELKMTRE